MFQVLVDESEDGVPSSFPLQGILSRFCCHEGIVSLDERLIKQFSLYCVSQFGVVHRIGRHQARSFPVDRRVFAACKAEHIPQCVPLIAGKLTNDLAHARHIGIKTLSPKVRIRRGCQHNTGCGRLFEQCCAQVFHCFIQIVGVCSALRLVGTHGEDDQIRLKFCHLFSKIPCSNPVIKLGSIHADGVINNP